MEISMLKRTVVCVIVSTAMMSLAVRAEITVPPGFTVTTIAPAFDGQVPQLSAINDAEYGVGVISAGAGNGIATFRLIANTGAISVLATHTGPSLFGVTRVRHDRDGIIDGRVHATVYYWEAGITAETGYLTLDASGDVVEHWKEGSWSNRIWYDFDFSNGTAGIPQGSCLLDGHIGNGTRLSSMDTAFNVMLVHQNSLPAGRVDTDVQGFQRDTTGLYGGGILLADSDDDDNISAIYEMSDVDQGGTYRAITEEVPLASRFYGDLAISTGGDFGAVVYITETVTDEIQTVDPNGVHTTWATGFLDIDSLAISPDGNSMYVGDANGIHWIRSSGDEPGPVALCHDPSAPAEAALTGNPPTSLRVIFNEPVSFVGSDVTILDANGQPVASDTSGSGSQFMIIGLAQPLENDTYTVTVADTVTSVATGQPLDGDNNGVAGGDYVFSLRHRNNFSDFDDDGDTDLADFNEFQSLFTGPLP